MRCQHALLFLTLLPTAAFCAEGTDMMRNGGTLTIRAIPAVLGAVPRGAQRVRLLGLEFRASCARDIALEELHLRQVGLGDASGIARIYLLQGNQRLMHAATISSDDRTVVLRPRQHTLPACETTRIDIAADFTADVAVGSEYRFEIFSPDDIVTDAAFLRGDFPLRNRALRDGDVTPLPAGGITVTFLSVSGTIQVVREETLAKFRVDADGETHHLLHAVTLTNKGSAHGNDLRELFLRTSAGRPLTPVIPALDGKTVSLSFSTPYFLRRGDKVVFELRGRAYTRRRTLRFTLEEPADLATESTRRTERGR